MVNVGLVVKLVAKAGKEQELSEFLASAVPMAVSEEGTPIWLALRTDAKTHWIVDAFPAEVDRQAHLNGPIAAALMANAGSLLASAPEILPADVLGSKP